MIKLRHLLIFLLFLVSACSEQAPGDARHNSASASFSNDYHIGQYTAPLKGYSTNSFWIEGPEGVVLIGTQFLPSAALEAVDIAESYTGKKVVMAIVLHPTPDQFNGAQALTKRGIQVVSSQSVVDAIPAAHNKTWPVFSQRLQPDYPDALVLPTALWQDTAVFKAAGLSMKAYVVRAAMSDAHVLIELDGHLFTGDLVANKSHSWPGGDLARWLERLEEIRKFVHPRVIHPGRGHAMGGAALLDRQENYLRFVQRTVAEFYGGGEIGDQDKKDIRAKIVQHYPDYQFDRFLRYVIPAEWNRLLQDDHAMMGQQMQAK
ncbi:MAG: hydrolase [Gammaproteobacteria bacterium]|nr:hydrolase [Gammaproteobacteria bacterium]